MISQQSDTVGIASIGYYIPESTITSSEISKLSGIPLQVFKEKIGMEKKHIAAPDEQPSDMGIRAAREAVQRAGIDAREIGIIAYCGASFYDYRIWSPAARVQAALGADDCYAFEVKNGCNGGNLGINLCKNLALCHPEKEYALVVCSEKLSPLIDYTDKSSLSLFMVGDGAAAALLKKGEAENQLLEYASITDGSTVDCVKVPLGGTKMPYGHTAHDSRSKYICVDDPDGLDRILSQTYLDNYIKVITRAVQKSGYSLEDIDFLFTNQVKRSLSKDIFQSLGLSEKNTLTSIEDYGHMGTVDTLFNLGRAIEERQIKPGDLIVIASSGAGFTWAAMAVKFCEAR
ncbi:MAG: 3-oxoacyl-ACP synthase [Methanothrix sp.]